MAKIRSHPAPENETLKAIQGTKVWDSKVLTYDFAEEDQKDEVIFDLKKSLPPGKLEELYPGEEQILPFTPFEGVFHALNEENPADPADVLFIQAARSAIDAYARVVSSISFKETENFTQADLKLAGIDDLEFDKKFTKGSASTQPELDPFDGKGSFPGTDEKFASLSDYESYVYLNTSSDNLAQPKEDEAEDGAGNYRSFASVHEFGHSLGLAHPHDDGNGTTMWEGAKAVTADDNPLDNERYTVMSYEFGGLDRQSAVPYGHAVTPMALDIAALQNMYGPTELLHSGNTTYRLTDPNSAELDVKGEDGTISIGRAFYCIWDNGGTDTIAYEGASRVLINLNAATLSKDDDNQAWIDTLKTLKTATTVDGKAVFDGLPKELQDDLANPAYHTGGFFSRLFNDAEAQLGGYSIAKGAEIENAVGGSGNDVLIGNEGSNTLIGGAGADVIIGGGGNDTLNGGRGEDSLSGGTGNDLYIFDVNSADGSIPGSSEIDTISENGTADDVDGILINATGFNDLPKIEDHFDFYVTGNDLEIVFDLNNDGAEEGSVVIKGMNDPASRIETLSLFGETSVRQLDLVKLYEKLTVENSLADLPPPPPVPAPPPAPPPSNEKPAPEPENVQDLGGNPPTGSAPEPGSGPEPVDVALKDLPLPPPVPAPPSAPPASAEESAPEPPASETVQDLGGDEPSGDDTTGGEELVASDIPPPPDVPPPPPPSFSPDEVQDLGGDEPSGDDTTENEKLAFNDLPPPPDVPPPPPPSFSPDEVQDLGGDEPTVPDMESSPPPALDDMLLT